MKYLKLTQVPRISLVYRSNTPRVGFWIRQLKKYLPLNVQLVLAPEQKSLEGLSIASYNDLIRSDLIIALGGDGTYLRAYRLLKGHSVPILGIHLGTLGFLTPNRTKNLKLLMDDLKEGRLALLPRTSIEVIVYRHGKKILSELAINDVVLERGEQSHLIHMDLSTNKEWIAHAKGDGLIIATPVGSTAYNLAVGGPLLHPEAPVFSMSLIAPHSLTMRPIVVPDHHVIQLKMIQRRGSDICGRLVVDGQIISSVESSDQILIKKAKNIHYVVRNPNITEFELLREKLHFGERK